MEQGNRIDITALHPIYQAMGAAVQDSQRLELYLSFIITLLIDLSGGTLTDQELMGTLSEDEFKGQMASLGGQTLGSLIVEIKKKVGFTDQAVEVLRQALRARNFLIHRFYHARTDRLLNQAGREKALREIGQKRDAINAASALLDPVMNDLLRLKGIDLQQFRDEVYQKFEG